MKNVDVHNKPGRPFHRNINSYFDNPRQRLGCVVFVSQRLQPVIEEAAGSLKTALYRRIEWNPEPEWEFNKYEVQNT